MEITGKITAIMAIQPISEKFKKREFVVTTGESTPYPQPIIMQFTQDKCNILDNYSIGQQVKVQFNLRGREVNGANGLKYYNTLEAWRIEKMDGSANEPQSNSFDDDDLGF